MDHPLKTEQCDSDHPPQNGLAVIKKEVVDSTDVLRINNDDSSTTDKREITLDAPEGSTHYSDLHATAPDDNIVSFGTVDRLKQEPIETYDEEGINVCPESRSSVLYSQHSPVCKDEGIFEEHLTNTIVKQETPETDDRRAILAYYQQDEQNIGNGLEMSRYPSTVESASNPWGAQPLALAPPPNIPESIVPVKLYYNNRMFNNEMTGSVVKLAGEQSHSSGTGEDEGKRTITEYNSSDSTDICSKVFSTSSELRRPEDTNAEQEGIHRRLGTYNKVYVHKTSVQSQLCEHTEEKLHKCNMCIEAFSSYSDLQEHKYTHTGGKPFKCSTCNKGFLTKTQLRRHDRTHTGEKQFKCNICCKAFSESSYLRIHERTHTGEKPFKCNICSKAFAGSSYLRIHERIHTGEKPFKCNMCSEAFRCSVKLRKHERIHTGEKPYKCNTCGAAFRCSSVLRKHELIHTGEKPAKCNICSKAFRCSAELRKHERTHTGEKPFKCSICSKAFTASPDLKMHERTHTGEKPFKCSICNKAFTGSPAMRIHERVHTGEKPFKCHICSKAFRSSSVLRRHERTHTSGKPSKFSISKA